MMCHDTERFHVQLKSRGTRASGARSPLEKNKKLAINPCMLEGFAKQLGNALLLCFIRETSNTPISYGRNSYLLHGPCREA